MIFQQFAFFLPEIYFFFALTVLFSFGTFSFLFRNSSFFSITSTSTGWLSVFVLFFIFLLYFFSFPLGHFSLFSSVIADNPFTVFFKFFLVFVAIIFFLFATPVFKTDRFFSFEFPVLFLFSIFGMLFLISCNDLLFFYLALELQSFSLYILAASRKFSPFSTEAGLKYFVLGALSSSFLLFGISLIYGFTGTTNLFSLSQLFSSSLGGPFATSGFLLGILFLFSGLLFKLSFAPFHFWTPDVYDGSPLVVTSFFAIFTKIPPFLFFLRLVSFLSDFYFSYLDFVLFFSVASIFVGTFGALYQVRLKRFFAYTSIAHVGYIGLAFLTDFSFFAFYLVVYSLTNLALFSSLLAIRNVYDLSKLRYLSDLKGIFNSNPVIATFMVFNFFSMAGIPPLAGFFAKFYVVFSSVHAGFYFSAFFALFFSVVSTFYYLKLVKIIFFSDFDHWPFHLPSSYFSIFFSFVFSSFALFFVFCPDLFFFPLNVLAAYISIR